MNVGEDDEAMSGSVRVNDNRSSEPPMVHEEEIREVGGDIGTSKQQEIPLVSERNRGTMTRKGTKIQTNTKTQTNNKTQTGAKTQRGVKVKEEEKVMGGELQLRNLQQNR